MLELNDTGVGYLSHIFDIYDSEHNGLLSAMDLEHMFNRAPIPIYQVRVGRLFLRFGDCFVVCKLEREGGGAKKGWKQGYDSFPASGCPCLLCSVQFFHYNGLLSAMDLEHLFN